MKINEIAEKNYLWVEKMGWHNKTPLEALALVASEVGEAINECRNEKPSEEFSEELADIILRVLDLAHWQGLDIEKAIELKMAKNEMRGNRGRLK
jgi:NTP pyrophosphatase (non-canonical NTP hydrolase)